MKLLPTYIAKLIAACTLVWILPLCCQAQRLFTNKCGVVRALLDTSEIVSTQKRYCWYGPRSGTTVENGDSIITIIDTDSTLTKCRINSWANYKLHLITTGPLVATVKKDYIWNIPDSFHQYAFFETYGRGRDVFTLYHASSGTCCSVEIGILGNKYYIKLLKCGWY